MSVQLLTAVLLLVEKAINICFVTNFLLWLMKWDSFILLNKSSLSSYLRWYLEPIFWSFSLFESSRSSPQSYSTIQTTSIGGNMLSLWSSRTSCNGLWWIWLFRCDTSPKKIVKLITSILHMKRGKFMTKHSLFGSNPHFRSLFCHPCLDWITPIRFGWRFTSTSVLRRSLVCVNCELRCT